MSDYKSFIGRFLISMDLGIGEIIGIEEIGDNGLFYKVEFPKTNATNFFSVSNVKFRIVSDKKEIKEAIDVFNKEPEEKEFPSTQEKINFYKKSLKSNNVCELAKHLSSLNSETEVHAGINKSYKLALNSFVEEIEYVLKIENAEAKKKLGLELN